MLNSWEQQGHQHPQSHALQRWVLGNSSKNKIRISASSFSPQCIVVILHFLLQLNSPCSKSHIS